MRRIPRTGTANAGMKLRVSSRRVATALVVLSLVACGTAHLDAKVAKRLAVAKADPAPAYWLGPRYDGLNLVYVESGSEAFFKSSLYYADCSYLQIGTLSPLCHRVIEVDNDVPTRGEISTMGRCIFSTTIHGVTVATFPVNRRTLRVFARDATIYVSSGSRAESLQAIAALKPLNGRPLARRDVSAALGTCEAPKPKRSPHLDAKQRYEQRMKGSFVADSTDPIVLDDFATAAAPKAVLESFVSDVGTDPALLRNEAARIADVRPPAAVAAEHARLVAELRAYASVLDDVLNEARRDGLDEHRWRADRAALEPRIVAATLALERTIKAFQAQGYSIFVRSK